MSSTNHYYDQNLLGAAPEATKAQRQVCSRAPALQNAAMYFNLNFRYLGRV
jgi:hypothetical protein